MEENASITLDTDQAAAYLSDRNTAVSAGAGSGKTTVLAERYVRLVTQGELSISEVLTLTFTRKAAAEMYERIFKRLSASPDPRAKERLAQFDQARISTLDSFCTAVTRGASYRYGISGDFRVDEAELRRTAEETAVEIIMRHRRDEAVRRLVAARSFETIVQDLFADLALSAFGFVRPGNYAALGKKQLDFIKQETETCCREISELCRTVLAIDGSKSKSPALQKAQAAVRSRVPLQAVFDPDHINRLIETADFFMSPDSFRRPSGGKDPALAELREAAALLKDEQCPRLRSLAQTLLFEEDMLLIGNILDEYETLFLERKRAKGLLSFQDTAALAVDILTKDTELRGYYKRHIKAIMIDEFQDNNTLQKNLLYLLAERDDAGRGGTLPAAEDLAPDKLFFVGDEKQSIYRFRGADVSVFRGLARELGNGQEASISLRANYRSDPELVDFFNALFPGVFGKAEALFEAEFSPMRAGSYKKPRKPGSPPPVELHIQETRRKSRNNACEDEEDEPAEASKAAGEALAAAERIITGVTCGEFGFGDVAVLFKSTARQNEYERIFRQAGIPFSAADPRGLFLEGPANDFYALLRLALFPGDRNAYATVLRSPFVRLGDESVFKIMLENPEDPFPADPQDSWFAHPAERERYEQGRAVFARLGAMLDIQNIAPVLAYLWYETGYRTYLLYDESSRPNLEHFEHLYALALDADQRRLCMGAFLDELAPRMGTAGKTDTGTVPEMKGKTLFITVHKSKGLEFPVVILADAGSSGNNSRNNKPYFLDPEYGPVINLKSDTGPRDAKHQPINYFYFLRRDLIRQQEAAELKRLFYVAATRARERLIIIGSREITRQDEAPATEPTGEARLRAYIEQEPAGKLQIKSFLDLFSLGASGSRGRLPHYLLVPLTVPAKEEYSRKIGDLRKSAAGFLKQRAAGSSCLSQEDFYAMPPRPAVSSRAFLTSPSQMETYDASLHPRSNITRSKPLPAFKADSFLDISEAAEGPVILFPLKNRENPEDKAPLSGEDLRRKFGTLCHRMIEKLIAADLPKEDLKKDADQEVHTLFHESDLSERALKTLAEESLELARGFLAGPLGQEAAGSNRRQAEFPFILPLMSAGEGSPSKPVLIRGNMDLIYEYRGHCVVVDFKTDRYLHPESHRIQLACYRAAAKAFSDLPVKTVLVYLRNMYALPFDPGISTEELFELIERMKEQGEAGIG
ncbi:MAG: UvrD-helicase domain-containing protein [Treponema sp.]|jgi:ATP-dependent helicase/nuclease subunit A|nr:UvrD-helicase domain-containing protein [Treponema sp.]